MIHIHRPPLLLFLLFVCTLFSFTNLLWGSPFFFHPDERNIIYSIIQLRFPYQLNPHFFAYGSMPIYVTFFLGLAVHKFNAIQLTFDEALFMLRSISALLNILTLISIYVVGKRLWGQKVGMFAASFWTCSVGAIQYAHFGTFEMWQCFLLVWMFYISVRLAKLPSLRHTVWMSLIFGLLVATKISYLPLLIIPTGIYFLFFLRTKQRSLLPMFLVSLIVSVSIFTITNPYVFLDTSEFLNSVHYESSVALGTLPVFYTQGFLMTTPVIYQLLHVFPFLMNPFECVFALIAFVLACVYAIRNKSLPLFMLCLFIIGIFSNSAFLFVKWTRYMVPTLPFLYLASGFFLERLLTTKKKLLVRMFILILYGVAIMFSLSYIKTVFMSADTRVQASLWAGEHIDRSTSILTEPYDIGILPFNMFFSHMKTPDIYSADQDPSQAITVKNAWDNASILLLASQRISKPRGVNPTIFPVTAPLYEELHTKRFSLLYQTPCDIWCTITYMGNPFWFEETTSVFDHPFVSIYQRN